MTDPLSEVCVCPLQVVHIKFKAKTVKNGLHLTSTTDRILFPSAFLSAELAVLHHVDILMGEFYNMQLWSPQRD